MSNEPTKSDLRAKLKQMLGSLTADERHARSISAAALLTSTDEFRNAQVVMLFLSTPEEIDTSPVALRCWQEGKTVVVPKVSWDQKRMIPVELHSLSTDTLTTTGPGIREPIAGTPIPPNMIDLVLVPGLGFTPHGKRVGRGMGFYDRFLSPGSFLGVSCGYAFEMQLVPDMPTADHDVPVMMLVTDKAVRRFSAYCLGST